MQNVTGAVIAAAGMGTRIGLGMPKCMIEIDGITILTRLLSILRSYVSVIHLVVGYREEMIIEYCARYHRDVVLIRNPDFRTTNTAYSFSKGAQHLTGKVLYLDGDLLISEKSLRLFLAAAQKMDILIGLTNAKSENAVFAHSEMINDYIQVIEFSRSKPSGLEWANVVVAPNDFMDKASGYVFEQLIERLPLNGYMLELAEVDTANDLEDARKFVEQMSS